MDKNLPVPKPVGLIGRAARRESESADTPLTSAENSLYGRNGFDCGMSARLDVGIWRVPTAFPRIRMAFGVKVWLWRDLI